jgi:3-oxoacyl-[acyl-carrier protein] reductase
MTILETKVVWITGGGRGIGKAAALAFAKHNALVAVSSRSEDELLDVCLEISKLGRKTKALAIPCDVTKTDSVKRAAEKIKSELGPTDILINNAGIATFNSVLETTEENWDNMMAVNAKGAFLCSKAVLADMIKKQTGHIININSVAGKKAFPNCAGYSASKQALQGFTEVLRLEAREHGIKVTGLFPGATETAIWGQADVDYGKMMKPADVAKVLVDVCTDEHRAFQEEIILRPIGGDL